MNATAKSNLAKPELTISIVIGSNKDYILPCLHSIKEQTALPHQIYVVDNGMSEPITQLIKEKFPQVEIIQNKGPKSFAQNHNMVIKRSQAEFIALLNDDILILDSALDKLVAFLQATPTAGVAGPKLLNVDGSLQPSTYGFPSLTKLFFKHSGLQILMPPGSPVRKLIQFTLRPIFPRAFARYWDHNTPLEAEVLKAACLVVRRKTIEDVGPMDEVTLAYGEEDEWLYRFKKHHWSCHFRPEAEIIHYGGSTTGKISKLLIVEQQKAILNFYQKHGTAYQLTVLKIMLYLLTAIKFAGVTLLALFGSKKAKKHQRIYLACLRLISSPVTVKWHS